MVQCNVSKICFPKLENTKISETKISERKHLNTSKWDSAHWEMFKDALVEPSFAPQKAVLYSKSLFSLKEDFLGQEPN